MPKSMPVVELQILRFINKCGPVPMDRCLAHFGDDARPRIVSLFNANYIDHAHQPGTVRSLGFVATTKGRNALQDSRWATYEHVRDSVLIPVLVSFITALVAPDLWSFTKALVLPFLRQIL